ncbi:MAG TPA: DegV family protein [Candidatus Acidoferrales bacterium]|nr:DegV family protein [Candidatus Acidoferrales bacterium]
MSPIAVVTDSTADLGDLAVANNIAVVPLTISFGNEVYRDGIDLSREAFYRKLETSHHPPATAQPAPSAFVATYRQLFGAGASGIISLHLSSKLSGTYGSACAAAREVGEEKIVVLDTHSVTLALGLIVLAAAVDAKAGLPLADIAERAQRNAQRTGLFATIPSLTYLARGGRIGPLQSILGNVLKIVPIITLRDGEVAEYSKVRTFARAVDQIVEIVGDRIQSRGTARVAVLHSVAPELADSVAARIERSVAPALLFKACVGPTVGTHAGPGAVGVAFAP